MKPFLTFFILLFVSLVLPVSCVSRKPPEPVIIENTKTVTEIVKDTVFTVEADSSYYHAYVECVNGKPQIINTQKAADQYNRQNPGSYVTIPKSMKGKNLNAPNVHIDKDGKLTADCTSEALKLYKFWKETYIKENQKESRPVYIEKPFRWYHKALMWIGGLTVILAAIGLATKFYKP